MTQIEFDKKMQRINLEQETELAPIKEELAELNEKKRALGYEMQAMQARISALTQQRYIVQEKLRKAKTKYYQMKHQLIVENPKQTEGQSDAEQVSES